MTGNWKSILRLDRNNKGRDFVCGDIHGCFDELESELAGIGFKETADRLFCVGDLIDRGPKSELAIRYMKSDWFYPIMGNHEHMFLMANMDTPDQDVYFNNHLMNGGEWAYKMVPDKIETMLEAMDKLPLIIQVGDIIIAHAVLPPVESLEEIEENPATYMKTVLWFRGDYPSVKIPGISKVYVGHSIIKNPEQTGKHINIDTGAFLKYRGREGKLTVLEIGM